MSADAPDEPGWPGDGVDLWICRVDDVRSRPGLAQTYRDLMTEEER